MSRRPVHISAKRVMRGDSFELFGQECFVVEDAVRNDFGQTVIRFVQNPSSARGLNTLVVENDTKIGILPKKK